MISFRSILLFISLLLTVTSEFAIGPTQEHFDSFNLRDTYKPIYGSALATPLKTSYDSVFESFYERHKDIKRVTLRRKRHLSSRLITSNTIYYIDRNLNLKGATLHIPDSCILYFQGGGFYNGSVVFNNTEIVSNSICFRDIKFFSGTIIDRFNLDWVDISEKEDVSCIVNSIFDVVTSSKALLLAGKERSFHVMDIEIINRDSFEIDCNCIFMFPDMMPAETTQRAHHIISLVNCNNFKVKKLKLDGNSLNNYCYEWSPKAKNKYNVIEANYMNEYRHCLSLYNCHNGTFDQIYGRNPCGDVVTIGGLDGLNGNSNLSFSYIEGKSVNEDGSGRACGRNVVSIVNGNHLFFDCVYSYYVGHATMPGGFDIEPNHDTNQYCDSIIVNKLFHEGKSNAGLGVGGTVFGHVNHVVINRAIVKNYQKNKEQRPVDILGVYDLTINHLEIYSQPESGGLCINVSGPRPISKNITVSDLYIENAGDAIQLCNVDYFNLVAKIHNWSKNAVYFIYKEGTVISNGSIDINTSTDKDLNNGPERFFMFNNQVNNISVTGNLEKTNLKKELTSTPIYISNDIAHLDVNVSKLIFSGYSKTHKIDWERP